MSGCAVHRPRALGIRVRALGIRVRALGIRVRALDAEVACWRDELGLRLRVTVIPAGRVRAFAG